jgi:hypothetical protein
MTRLPRLTGKEVIDALNKAGFQVIRTKGSHHFLQHPDGRITEERMLTSNLLQNDFHEELFSQ